MRWNQSCAVQKFIRSALAFSCLSVIPLSGCSNSSSRNFSLGLREEAAKSALRAEEQLAEQKARTAEGKAEGNNEAELASREARRSPLLNFLRGEPKASGDPFLDSKSESVAAAEKTPEQKAAASEKSSGTAVWDEDGALQVSGTRREAGKSDSSWDSVMKDYLAEGAEVDRPAWERPFSPDATQPQISLTEQLAKAAESDLTSGVGESPWSRSGVSGAGSRVVGPEAPANWATQTAAESSVNGPVAEWATSSTASRDTLAQPSGSAESSTRGEYGVAQAKRVPVARMVDEAQATKLRIQSLLSQAHSDLLRGDAYSAYRSALLAQQETEKHSVDFLAGEERPSELVNQISRRLWGPQQASVTSHSGQSSQPNPQPAADWGHTSSQNAPSVPQNAIFDDVKQSEWIAVPEGPANGPRVQPQASRAGEPSFPSLPTPAATAPARGSDVIRLPEIRSQEGRKIQRLSASAGEEAPGLAELAYAEQPVLEQSTLQEPSVEQPPGNRWDEFKQAADQQVAKPARPRSLSAPSWTEWAAVADGPSSAGQNSEPPAREGWKSALAQAPAPPIEAPIAGISTAQSAPVVAAVSQRVEPVTARTGTGNSKWAIIGFVAALAATVLGLRVKRESA